MRGGRTAFVWDRYGLVQPPTRPPIPGGPQSVADVLAPLLQHAPDDEGLIGRAGRYTWRQLDSRVSQAVRAFAKLGVQRYDRVGISLPNDTDIVIAFLAAMRLGVIWVGINRQLAAPEKASIYRDAGCVLLITDDAVAATLDDAEDIHLISLGQWRTHVDSQPTDPLETPAIDPFEPAAIAYTSGTTGAPKGVVHSQHNLMAYGAAAREANLFGTCLHAGVQLPLTILNLFVIQVLNAFQNGGKCVCMNVKSSREFAELVEAEQVAHIATVPTVYYDMLNDGEIKPSALSSVRLAEIGGTNVPRDIVHDFADKFGVHLVVSYGSTEAPATITRACPGEDPADGYVGLSLPHVAVAIAKLDGTSARPDEEGDIWIGPASSGPMTGVYLPHLGYWKQPELTNSSVRGTRFRTGDIGSLDADGRLYIRGRQNDLIIRGGANVHGAEVERVIDEMDGIHASAVMGVADERLGQRVVAAVELDPGATVTEDAVRAHCLQRLAKYKVPDTVAIVDALPRNAMQKIVKAQLAVLFDLHWESSKRPLQTHRQPTTAGASGVQRPKRENAMQSWTVGDVQITKVLEQEILMPAEVIVADLDPMRLKAHREWMDPSFVTSEGQFRISIHSLVVRSQGRTIVVDTCMGNDRQLPGGFGPLHTDFLDQLTAVVNPAEVDYVVCSHLHFDHIGWNVMLDGDRWVPTFPQSRHLFVRREYEHWIAGGSSGYLDLSYGVEPIVEAGLHDLVGADHRITDEVSLFPTPGHTPGHVSFLIESRGEVGVITGDMVHHPVQFAEPAWYTQADADPLISIATRRAFVDRFSDRPVTIFGTHFAGPTAGHLMTRSGHTVFICDIASPCQPVESGA